MVHYRALTWDDFNGVRKPFTGWAAAIDSDVFVDFDSISNRFRAYAAMNAATSWKKSGDLSDYLLNHEQYHFNLTQYYALKLDQQLKDIEDIKQVTRMLNSIQVDLRKAQRIYDLESDHNLNFDMQDYWEFKIDSLNKSAKDSIRILKRDLYTGIQFYNLGGFEKSKRFTKNGAFETKYSIKKYGLNISINSVKNEEMVDPSSYESVLKEFYSKDSLLIHELERTALESQYAYYAHLYDTTDNILILDYWLTNETSMHVLRAQTDDADIDIRGYKQIFQSLTKSMNIHDFYSEWITIAANQEQEVSPVEKYDPDKDEGCMVIDKEDTPGFIPDIINNNNINVLVPYTPVIHADSLISDVIAFYDDQQVVYDMSDSIVIELPADHFKPGFELLIGYTLKSDTLNKCKTYYNRSLVFN